MKIFKLLSICCFVFMVSCFEEVPTKFETEDDLISIADFLEENAEEFSSYISVMKAANLEDALSAYNPLGEKYTLFLPSNEAFERFIAQSPDYGDFNSLLADIDYIRALARYHVVNRSVATNDFPLGALPDSSLTGDYLIIAYIQGEDSTYYKVNNVALVEREDMEMTNGIIHVIDNVLEPITQSGFDWIRANDDYTIIADLFEITGLEDTLGLYITDESGKVIENGYSLLVEADSIYNKSGIYSVSDLAEKYSPDNSDYEASLNPLNQFAAYHILEESRFLADLYEGANNYNTYAALPVQIRTGIDIRVNIGVEKFDSIYDAVDSLYTYVDYLTIMVNESNIQTKNGPIHFVNRVMELYQPKRTRRTFEFYEEPNINKIRTDVRRYIFTRQELFSEISWSGTEELVWEKTSNTSEKANYKDFLEIEGDFLLTYKIPKVLPGTYGMQIRVNTDERDNATIQVYLDGKQVGGNLNLTTGGVNNSNPYRIKNMGIVEFSKYERHTVTIRSLIPGKLVWDWVRFESDTDLYDDNNQ